jgi:hypothetical protein
MAITRRIARPEWEEFFERYTRQRLQDEVPQAATIEVTSAVLGDQIEASAARLVAVTYDPESSAVAMQVEASHEMVFHPEEVWVIEEEGGFVSALELLDAEGTKEIITLRRGGPPARLPSPGDFPR